MSTSDGAAVSGKTILVTGASDGIGAVLARELHAQGARVLLTGRSPEKTGAVAKAIGVEPLLADFGRLDDVRALAAQVAEQVDHLDVLVNNAGGTFAPARTTHDGHEPNFQINHLSPFLLTQLLRPQLAAAGASLVLNTSSVANLLGRVVLDDLDAEHRRVGEMRAYGTGKLMNILFTHGIAQRWADDGVVSAAVHPGNAASSFGRDSFLIGLLYRTPLRRFASISVEDGAAPLLALVRRGADPAINGVYFDRFEAKGRTSGAATDQELIDGLWEASERLTAA